MDVNIRKVLSFEGVGATPSGIAIAQLNLKVEKGDIFMTTESGQTMAPTRITADELIERMNRGEPFTILDTRNPKAWSEAETKLPGALRITADELENHLDKIPRDRAIITYCT